MNIDSSISTAVRAAGPCNLEQAWWQADKCPGEGPHCRSTPRAEILVSTVLSLVISFSYHKAFGKVVTNVIS